MNKIYIALTLLAGALFVQNAQAEINKGENIMENKKILVAYYSYSGNTKEVAKAIHKKVGGDIFEQAKKEIEENYRPKLTTSVADIAQYDVIFLGSPNWWGTITPQVSSFIETYNLSGKRIIPFITNGGGGVQRTISDMTKQCKGCDVEQNGWVGYGNETSGLDAWLRNL